MLASAGDPTNQSATCFAPAGRDSVEEIGRKHEATRKDPTLQAVLDSMPSWMLVLNRRRQVVGVNSSLLKAANVSEDSLLGKRPGEILGCVNSATGPDGCGTADACAGCGAVLAMLESLQAGTAASGTCRLRTGQGSWGHAIELEVRTMPVEVGGESLLLVGLEDISATNRLAVLTRIFFHDAMNTVVGLATHLSMLERKAAQGPIEPGEIAALRKHLDGLADEIRAQRELTLAESGDLEVVPETVSTAELVDRLVELHATNGGRRIFLGEVWDGELSTDGRLLLRVLDNMLRNALEASPPDRPVTIACADRADRVRFAVHNEQVMPEPVRRQIFQRSFSTKAVEGRGIGTHSMKLIGERYLRGTVDFTSDNESGTTFWIELPKHFQDQGDS